MMTPLIRVFVSLVIFCTSAMALLADPPSERPPHGKGWYVMVLWESGTPIEGHKGQFMKDLPEPDLNGLGGKILHSKDNRRLIELPVAAAEALRKHKSVAYLQRLWTGEPIEELAEHVATTRSAVATEEDATLQWGPRTYLYDDSGNIKQFGPDNYTYDTAGRLVQATVAGKTQTFKYDAFGNLVEMAVNGASPVAIGVDPSSNRLVGVTYDVAGNLVQGRRAYFYDALNMLTRIIRDDSTSQHKLYDVNDEQIAVVTQTTSRWTIRGFDGKVLREFTADASSREGWDVHAWTWQSDYVYGEGTLVGGESLKFSSYEDPLTEYGGVRHYHLDHLGSVRMVTNNAKRSLSQNDFFPFGVSATRANQEPVNNSDVQTDEMRFAGHQRDYEGYINENTDYLDYMHARYYDPNMGRFLSVDPVMDQKRALSDPQSWNRYAYAGNNPINRVDPDGRADNDFRCYECTPEMKAAFRSGLNEALSFGISFVPTVGDVYDAVTAVTGRDLFTGEKLGTVARVAGVLLPLLGTGSINRISSIIHNDNALVKFAETAGKSHQGSLDHLVKELGRGNLNPGIGTKNVFGKVFEARARDGARVYFRQGENGVEILAKSTKANQDQVIKRLRALYE